jgi:hypothetical protein
MTHPDSSLEALLAVLLVGWLKTPHVYWHIGTPSIGAVAGPMEDAFG